MGWIAMSRLRLDQIAPLLGELVLGDGARLIEQGQHLQAEAS
jgi:hypothetical protein